MDHGPEPPWKALPTTIKLIPFEQQNRSRYLGNGLPIRQYPRCNTNPQGYFPSDTSTMNNQSSITNNAFPLRLKYPEEGYNKVLIASLYEGSPVTVRPRCRVDSNSGSVFSRRSGWYR